MTTDHDNALRRAVLLVAVLNLAYFGVEFAVALKIGSVALLADSIDFLEDASINVLIMIALRWSATWRSRVGKGLSLIIFVPALATLWMAWQKVMAPIPPSAESLTLVGAGALAVNFACAIVLVRHRHHGSSLAKAAWLSARNDVLANVAIIAAGLLTALTVSAWPDLVVGVGIGLLNADAARQVWSAASRERIAAEP